MHRLKRLAMDINSFQSSINQVSQKGRTILKSLEDFKFTLEQTARLLNNNQDIAQGMIQKRKGIDELTGKLYQIVFDIENMDISQAYTNQNNQVTQTPGNAVNNPNQQGQPNKPGIPGQPPMPNANPGGNNAPVPGGAPMPNMPKPPKPPENNSDDKKTDDKSEEKPKDESPEKEEE